MLIKSAVRDFRLPRGVNKIFVFWDVTQRRLIVTDVSGQRIGPIFKGQTVPEEPPRRAKISKSAVSKGILNCIHAKSFVASRY